MNLRSVIAAAALALVATALPAPAHAAPVVRFVKVYVNSPGADSGSNTSLNAEWIRVKNFGSRAKVLTGWTIRDPEGHVFRFPRFTLRAGATVTVHTGRGRNTATNLYWSSDWYVWNNSGDRAILKSRTGAKVDTCSWRTVRAATTC
jgi:hypothetical protein